MNARRYSVLVLMLVGGCAQSPQLKVSFSHDSAGIAIVENFAPEGPPFRLDSLPAVDIGPGIGPHGEFISPISAVRLSDGRIVAVGWAMTEMTIFAPTGRWLHTVGRAGAGPGEFEALGFVFRGPADSLITFEPGSQRVQRWTTAGEFVTLSTLVSLAGRAAASVRGVYPDGSLLLSTSIMDVTTSDDLTSRSWVTLFRVLRLDGPWDSLMSYLSGPALRHPANPQWSYGAPLFEPMPSVDHLGNQLAFSAGERFEIMLYGPTGQLQRIVRRAVVLRRVSEAEFDKAVTVSTANTSPQLRVQLLPRLRKASSSRTRPPVNTARLATDGRLWVLFGEPSVGEPIRAAVFDRHGRLQADVVLPAGAQINQIDQDGILINARDPEGFYHLRFYRFVRTTQ